MRMTMRNGDKMQSSWVGWLAFVVLAAMVLVTSCQASFGETAEALTHAVLP